jgi:Leucine-rich repeat (LRR) protein
VTTSFLDPFEFDDCIWEDNVWPHVINQCQCLNRISRVANDTLALYWKIRPQINALMYGGQYNEDIASCAPSNAALLWLSSGSTRDSGDLYQRYILALMYLSLNGTEWDDNRGWMSNENECTWKGVECTLVPLRVNRIKLPLNNIHGSLPSEMAYLEGLHVLNMTRNHLTGVIPPQLFNLSKLEDLDLSANSLRGSLPTSLSRAAQLRSLSLNQNFLSGELDAEAIGSLRSLQNLSLAHNEMWRALPSTLGQLTRLERLDLQENRFSGTLPSEWGSLGTLSEITLSNNLLSGTIPNTWSTMRTVRELRLSGSGIGGTLPGMLLASLSSSLTRLDLGSNNFVGTLTTDIGLLVDLSELNLADNNFSGSIPTELGQLKKLVDLRLSHCLFSGTLPTEMGEMTQLRNLFLGNNHLTGTAPEELCALRTQGSLQAFVADCPPSGLGFGLGCPATCCTFCINR